MTKTWLVVTFHTTAAAIGMEKLCAARGLAGRLIPCRARCRHRGLRHGMARHRERAALEALAAGEGLGGRGLLRADAVQNRPDKGKQDGQIIRKNR